MFCVLKRFFSNHIFEKVSYFLKADKITRKIENIVDIRNSFNKLQSKKEDLESIVSLKNESDPKNAIYNEILNEEQQIIDEIDKYEDDLINILFYKLNKQAIDDGAVLEIRAGTGGDDATVFANDLLNMYKKYSEYRKWEFIIAKGNKNEYNGIKEAIVLINGYDVLSWLNMEAGVHRVQRVPFNSKSIHTSTATVAILPQSSQDPGFEINNKDLKVETMRSSGPGGQHVNKTESAIRITHLPSNISVHIDESRSQIKNRKIAMAILKSKLISMEMDRHVNKELSTRRTQIGSAERHEKIRTYHFIQERLTDHRLDNTYNTDLVLNNPTYFQQLLKELRIKSLIDQLETISNS